MLKLIEKAMDKLLLPNKHFQDYINNRYNTNEYARIPIMFLKETIEVYNKLMEYLWLTLI